MDESKMEEFKMAEFKMAAIIKVSQNELVKFFCTNGGEGLLWIRFFCYKRWLNAFLVRLSEYERKN